MLAVGFRSLFFRMSVPAVASYGIRCPSIVTTPCVTDFVGFTSAVFVDSCDAFDDGSLD